MKQIIKDGEIVEDTWEIETGSENFLAGQTDTKRPIILPLQIYEAHVGCLVASNTSVGILIKPDDDWERILPYLDHLPLIAVEFHNFADGRGYSIGQLLRLRHGFDGELRAVGDVLRDQLYFLNRCGFNSFELREDQNLQAALAAFRDYAWLPNSRIRSAVTL